jgi:hypothetical protein
MATLFETVQQFFVDEGWKTEPMEDEETTLKMRYQGKRATWTCFARVRELHGQVTFYSLMSGTVPDDRLTEVAELMARINFKTVVGNFEVDFESGEVRVRTSMDFGPDGVREVPFPRLFGRLVGTNVQLLDNYIPAVLQVIGGEAALQALENIGEAY